MTKYLMRTFWIFLAVFGMMVLTACGGEKSSTPGYTYPKPLPTMPAMPTRTPWKTETPAVATETPVVLASATSMAQATSTSEPVVSNERQSVQIFLVAIGDNGDSGKKFGCDDSLIPVEVKITPTVAVLRAALTELLSLDEAYYGQSGLYTALSQSDLSIDKLYIQNGVAYVYLVGELMLGGTCDNPRVEEQLKATTMQFSTVNSAKIFINEQPLEDVLSLK